MSKDNNQNDIVQRLKSAAAEMPIIEEKLKQADSESYDHIKSSLAANYQLLMDEAAQEMDELYRSTGNLTNARLCEINSGISDYSLSVQGVMTLMKELHGEE